MYRCERVRTIFGIHMIFTSSHIKKIKSHLFLLFVVFTVCMALIPLGTYAFFARDLQSRERIMNRKDTGLILYDRHNTAFFTFYQAKHKTTIPLSRIPLHVRHAVIAAEDQDFYSHAGFSIRAMVRSLRDDIKARNLAYGGSTITQQLVKNALLTSRKQFLRKIQEVILASEIERRFTKDEILEMYLNSVYFGEGAFGIEAASDTYFGKDPEHLTLAQASFLVGILPSPSALSPFGPNKESAVKRQRIVLDLMQTQGYISESEKSAAIGEDLAFKPGDDNLNSTGAHFALMVRDILVKQFGEETISRSGFKVRTTLDLSWQKYAEDVVARQVKKLEENDVSNGATVVINPDNGEILTLVGSRSWYDEQNGKINMALSPRQPGSSFKPIVYAAAMEQTLITAATLIDDKPKAYKTPQGPYTPKNYDGKFRGPVLVRRALANSLNLPSVEIMVRLGVPQALDFAKKVGITTLKDPSQYGVSLVLGTGEVSLLELTNAYGVFANGGNKHTANAVMTILDKSDETVFETDSSSEKVLSSGVAYIISSILSDKRTRSESFGSALDISKPAAVKTGTTEDYRDSWTIGYVPHLVVGVWVGNNDNTPMNKVAGSLGAAPIWRQLMEHYIEGINYEEFKKPRDIVSTSICRYNGLLVTTATSSGYLEHFLPGTKPTRPCFVPAPSIQVSATPVSDLPISIEPEKDNEDKEAKEKERNERRADRERERGRDDD